MQTAVFSLRERQTPFGLVFMGNSVNRTIFQRGAGSFHGIVCGKVTCGVGQVCSAAMSPRRHRLPWCAGLA